MSLNNETTVNWGMIGCGAVAEVKSGPAYQQVANFKLTAVMRRNEGLAKDYAERHKVEKYFSNANDLINDESIDAVYIATPPDTHKDYGIRVAEAGKPCCIEKPLAPSYQDSKEILEAFDKANVPLFVAYYRRSLPRFNKIKSLLDAGEIGELRHISWHLSKPANELDLLQEYNWRTDKKIALGGYFDDLASHGLDLFAYLLGDFDVVKGVCVNQQKLYSAYDAITASWVHRSGVTGSGSWNFGTYSRQDNAVIYGSNGEISFSVFEDVPISVCNLAGHEEIYVENPKNVQFFHVQNIREQLFSGGSHPSNGATATHTSWVMDEILRNEG